MEKEEWKDVKGYEGYYQISNFGRVKSLSKKVWNGSVWWTTKERILRSRTSKDKTGYASVQLCKDSLKNGKNIHRLVAEAFVQTEDFSLYVNHKDENKLNNHYLNLEWVTPSENLNYGENQKRKGDKRFVKVFGIHKDTGEKVVLENKRQCIDMGFNKATISQVLSGKNKTHKGYVWHKL